MSLLAFELSDAGIMAAAGNPARLLAVDGSALESPGFALPEKKQLTVGKAAQSQAHIYPQKIVHRFWDRLDTTAMKLAGRKTSNHAEIAYAHLAMIWAQIQPLGSAVIVTVPGFMTSEQMGLILGITQELGMPVKGFVSQAVAAAPRAYPDSDLFYLDIHLHRTEVSLLAQGDHLTVQKTLSLDDFGLIRLHRLWVECIAETFVRTTRFDPLHQAASEQALYDRLPEIVGRLDTDPAMTFDVRSGQTVHNITLTRQALADKSQSFFDRVQGLVQQLSVQDKAAASHKTMLLSHRAAGLVGLKSELGHSGDMTVVEADAGAGAINALQIWESFAAQATDGGAPFINQRPWQSSVPANHREAVEAVRPTHLLFRHLACPIPNRPMGLRIEDGRLRSMAPERTSSSYPCTIGREDDQVVLAVHGDQEVLVDGAPIKGRAILNLGQSIQLGRAEDTIRLIACVDADEA